MTGDFLVLKKGKRFSVSACARKRSFKVLFTEPKQTWPSDQNQKKRFLCVDNEAISVLITPKSRANLTTLIFSKQTNQCLQVPRKIFIMPGHYKKILPAQQPIRAHVLL